MIHITDDIYDKVADHIRNNLKCECENQDYATFYCKFKDLEHQVDGDDMVAVLNGCVSVNFLKSREMWGIELCERGASGDVECSTLDQEDNVLPNDFNLQKLFTLFYD